MFTHDRDLLLFEPNLFGDVAWIGQRLLDSTGTISGTTLTVAAPPTLEDMLIDAGHVAVVNQVPYEVIERLSPTEATVSRPRADPEGPVIPPIEVTDEPTSVHTFVPQIALVHSQVLQMIGIPPNDEELDGPTEQDVTNPGDLTRLESLGALHLIFSAAAALAPETSPLRARAEMYRDRFAAERRRAVARLDLNGDGLPDASRRLNVVQFMRA